jgi:hypothetical protein
MHPIGYAEFSGPLTVRFRATVATGRLAGYEQVRIGAGAGKRF